MKRKILACLLCVLIAIPTLLLPRAGAAGDIYFTAINDNLLPLTSGTMPAWVDGVLYVPYTVFDSSYTGVNLRISWNQNRSNNTFTLYTLNDTLVFDFNQNNSKNAHTGELFYYKAITRNNKVYVPIAFVCSFFGLNLSRISTPYGELVRIKNTSVVLSDRDFSDAAASLMESRLKKYNQSLEPADPSPDPSPSGDDIPPSDDPTDSHQTARVYLSVVCQQNGELSGVLDVLDRYAYTALVLVRPDDLDALQDEIRHAVASGHTIGFLLSENEALPSVMEEANASLFRIACIQTSVFSMESGSRGRLSDAGYVEYRPNVTGSTSATRTIRLVEAHAGTVRLLLPTGAGASSALSNVLTQLRQAQYQIRPAVEPEF